MIFSEGLGIFLRPTILVLKKFFCNQFCSFLDKVNTQISEDFEQILIRKLKLPQFPKISFKYNGHKVYLTKPNSRKLALLTKTLKYKYFPKLHTCPKSDVSFASPALCRFQIWKNCSNKYMMTALADFINTNTKNSQMKHYPCLRYPMIYRPNL